ncbi:paraquat-inducible protein A [Motiliproteus sp. MSK22-1]|uniref:paraquat-inducible protein A n=1 Tax=Motiliproteus sp. MSK22-1 TaxID=1897630 RepID=UPI000975E55B|nr:paraquat-inducible protein A [Motiliproteus sp. MSK22-1]OMH32669.1 paraquat-inducible protein A [Motiliproteus sp. MSK22-1]
MKTAINAGLALCHCCHKLQRLVKASPGERACCIRCGSGLHARLPNSIMLTWGYTLAGFIMMIPANFYPIMTVVYLGRGEPDTIMSGVMHLAQAGMYPIAILVFVASIAVPLIKLLGLTLLLLAVQRHWKLSARQCTLMYRIIEFIGRWSMLDLFMISVLVTLVDLGSIATITAGPGASAFATVVVLTILAALSFDPRLIWDREAPRND